MTDAAKRDKDRQFELEALCWFPDLTRYALSLTRNEADADDLVQDTFLRAYSSMDEHVDKNQPRCCHARRDVCSVIDEAMVRS